MAKSSPNANCTARFLFLKVKVRVLDKKRNKPVWSYQHPIGSLRAKKLIDWLDFNAEKNSTRLIKFIVAVRDKYNKLAANYNQLNIKQNKVVANYNQLDIKQNKRLADKQKVIHYLQGQVADLTA